MNRGNIFFDYLLPIIILVALTLELFYTCNNESTKKEEKQNISITKTIPIDSISIEYIGDSNTYYIQTQIDVYNLYCVLLVTKDIEYAVSFINALTIKNAVSVKELTNLAGITVLDKHSNPIIWVNGFEHDAYNHSILAHEIAHAAFSICNTVGIKYNDASEESYTYLIQEITEDFYKAIPK